MMIPIGGRKINRVLQERFGELAEDHIESRTGDITREYIDPITGHFGTIDGLSAVEIGTGWVPILPVALGLQGATCWTCDVVRHLDSATTLDTIRRVAQVLGRSDAVPPDLSDELAVCPVADILRRVGVNYEAPTDTTRLPIASETQDVTVSRAVLQMIPPVALRPVLAELYRVTKPGGLSIHKVHLHDEYTQGDPGVTLINFLKYPDWVWDNFGNNDIKYINRARFPDYIRTIESVGFRVVEFLEHVIDERAVEALDSGQLVVDREFRRYTHEELA
ncbi:MAG: class I SAM-dependent methyltransferase, partial [Myxococcota bacterium]